MYDPMTNGAEWIPICGTASNLLWVEEVFALALCNMVPHSSSAQSKRLNRFRENRAREDTGEEDGAEEGASPPESPCEGDTDEKDIIGGDVDEDNDNEDSSSDDA